MDSSILYRPEVLATLLGIANHLFFRKHEPFARTVPYALAALLVEPLLLSICITYTRSVPMPWKGYLLTYGVFYTSLLSSIILYRLSPFHPLARIPGPMVHKVSKLWSVWICWQGRQHTEFKAMHDKYGPVVRTGPNEISVIDPSAINDVLGAGGLPKGKWYLSRRDEKAPTNLISLSGEEHANRRRLWNHAFNTEALEEYDEILVKNAMQLVDGIQAKSKVDGEVDLTEWFNFFGFDFMADFVFSGGSDMLKKGEDEKGILDLLEHHMITGALISHIPWFFYLGNRIPGATESTLKMRKYAKEWVEKRLQTGAKVKDLWYHLTNDSDKEKPRPISEVVADALMAIVAGADTTSVALTNFIWMMLANPEHYKRVQEEIDRVYDGTEATDISKHSELKYLSACLDETLRLLPPGLTGGVRQVPAGGRWIAGHFLPEGTQVYLPPFVMHRNPECFSPHTNDFVPSRWLSSNSATSDPNSESSSITFEKHNRKAFLSFSYGPANCVGKKLARQEMLMVISLLMQRFEFSFGKDFDWEKWPETMRDYLTTSRGPLKVVARSK